MEIKFTNKAEYLQARTEWKAYKAILVELQKKYKILRNPANQPERLRSKCGQHEHTEFLVKLLQIQDAGKAQFDLYVGKKKINELELEIALAKKEASRQYLFQRDVMTAS